METVPDDWRKSSRSTQSDSCVEVRKDLAAIRDSKNADGPMLAIGLSGMLAVVKSGMLDRHTD